MAGDPEQTVNTELTGLNVTLLKRNYMQVKLYTMKGCSNCQLVKEHLDREEIRYKLIDCDKNMDEAVTAVKAAGSDILPIICYDEDNYIAGYDKDNIEKFIKLCKS